MSILAVAQSRQIALVSAWKNDSYFPVQVESPHVLGQVVFLEEHPSQHVSQVERRRSANVVCVCRAGNPDRNASLWVAASYSDYRAAYAAFVRQVYKIPATKQDLIGYDADHLLNKASSPKDTTFIRLEAVNSVVNQAWGMLYEAAASKPHLHATQYRERRGMRWPVASKLAGQMPPAGPDDKQGIARLVSFWVAQGFPAEQAQHGITDDLNFIFGRPRTNPLPTQRWI